MKSNTFMRKRIVAVITGIFVVMGSFIPYYTTKAVEFNRHLIISDQQMYDSSAMTLAEIQKFLELKNSYLATLNLPDVDGVIKSSAAIIEATAKRQGVNPKVILVAGSLSDLTKTQRNNFEIFRNSISDIEIITFDEVKKKIEYFLDLLEIKE